MQGEAHGKAAAHEVERPQRHNQQVGTGAHTLGGDLHKPPTLHDYTDRRETAHASLCRTSYSDSTNPAFKVASHAPSHRNSEAVQYQYQNHHRHYEG